MTLARGYITITALNDGKDNMLISLLPSANSVHKASSGALAPDKLSCRALLTLGGDREVIGVDTPIKYPGRNLIRNSKAVNTGNSSKYSIASWGGGNYIEVGKTYTILAELYCDETFAAIANSGIGFWISGMASLLPRFKPTTPTVVSLTFKATQNGYLTAYHYPSGSAGNSYINWVMLVEGDVIPEKWTPAPEDYKIKYNNANYTPGTQFTPTRDSIFNLWLGDNKIGQDVIVPMIVDGANGAQGPKGDVGPTGSQGVPGTSQYFHVKYSANANGNPMVDIPNTYIGTAVTASATAPTSYTSYKWVQFKGSQGPKGDQGIKGETGSNGVSSYLHIKYSDNGTSFTANNGETPGKWIGQYVDNNPTDSSSFSAYTWTKVKGDDGASAYTVVLTKDSQGISCNADGSVKSGELGSTSKTLCAITCLKGPNALSAVATTVTPTTGQYKYVATCVGGTVARKDNTSFYLSAMSADVATVSVAIYVENVQIFTKQVVYTKVKDGVDGSSLNLDEFSQKLGYADYADAVDKASKGETIIKGGYINTQLIQACTIVAEAIKAGTFDLNAGKIGAFNVDGNSIFSGQKATTEGKNPNNGITVSSKNGGYISHRNFALRSDGTGALGDMEVINNGLFFAKNGRKTPDWGVYDRQSLFGDGRMRMHEKQGYMNNVVAEGDIRIGLDLEENSDSVLVDIYKKASSNRSPAARFQNDGRFSTLNIGLEAIGDIAVNAKGVLLSSAHYTTERHYVNAQSGGYDFSKGNICYVETRADINFVLPSLAYWKMLLGGGGQSIFRISIVVFPYSTARLFVKPPTDFPYLYNHNGDNLTSFTLAKGDSIDLLVYVEHGATLMYHIINQHL